MISRNAVLLVLILSDINKFKRIHSGIGLQCMSGELLP